jgi:superfamily II DNA or RNA helicase
MDDEKPRGSLFKRARRDPLKGHTIEDPQGVAALLQEGHFASTAMHLLNLEAHHLKSLRHEGLTTLGWLGGKIKILPHQVKAAIRVLNEMQGRAILADEVGLGKTIEAGIILKELVARGRAKSILILTPAALAQQWQQELWDKFGERFIRHDDPEFEGFDKHNRVVTSIDTAKSNQHYANIISREWDLVVIDEAHYLKNKRTQRYHLADDLQARHALMLTATPIQNNLLELYNLINLIRPGLLGTLQNFEEEYVGDTQGRVLLHAKRLQQLLEQVMIRNRRSETTGIKFPTRKVETHRIVASKGEYELHSAVLQFIRNHKHQFESHLALMILEREVASSAPALSKTLHNMMQKVRDPDTLLAMENLKHHADSIKRNSKVNLVLEVAQKTGEKMIVFTQFRETQELLSRRLKSEGITSIKYHGQLTSGRRKAALDEFRSDDCQILIATDSGSEGLNLQFCHIMVNYDLPWNPMRVEQRIGRVHRIGQESDQVVILNLAIADTIEDHVLAVLYEKIKLFEVAIGEMDLILSDVTDGQGIEKRIVDIIMNTDSDEEVKEGLAKVNKEMERGKRAADEIKQLDASVFQQFDLSTSNDDVQIEDAINMDHEVAKFVQRFANAANVKMAGSDGVITLNLPRSEWGTLGGRHQFTTSTDVFEANDGKVELLSLSAGFVNQLVQYLNHEAPLGQVRTAEVDEPAVQLYYRYYIETIRSEVEAFVTVTVTDKGTVLEVTEGLNTVPDAETVYNPHPLTGEWETIEETARIEAGNIIAPAYLDKIREAKEDVHRSEQRLEQYYERLKSEYTTKQAELRRTLGEIESKLRITENGIRERKLQADYTKKKKEYDQTKFRDNKRVEKLDNEFNERLNREKEVNEPKLVVELIGATRLLPPKE